VKCQEELLALGEDKIDKKTAMYKITLPSKPKNNEWVDNYRKQEFQRYSNPTKPWVYSCEDGRKVTVAPVAKKLSVLTGKPRDHPLLKSERPACVTILTLVRDAAARLPNGVGTRADISELLKESQYVNEDLPEEKLSNIVSGALDRLHYMTDACVKYDSEKKLWIYLHSDRNYEHPGWGEDGEDYLDKYPSKKKKRDFE
jgi:nuclear factor related to kappa-B-binding protein